MPTRASPPSNQIALLERKIRRITQLRKNACVPLKVMAWRQDTLDAALVRHAAPRGNPQQVTRTPGPLTLPHPPPPPPAPGSVSQAKLKYWQKQCELLHVDLADLQATEREEEAKAQDPGTSSVAAEAGPVL